MVPRTWIVWLLLLAGCQSARAASAPKIDGEQRVWKALTLTFQGPEASEEGMPNPFRDYRLDVVFTHVSSGRRLVVPGFFAADGDAANTSATSGDKWRVHFLPDAPGRWEWVASFRSGRDIAVAADASSGQKIEPDGQRGTLDVEEDTMAKGGLKLDSSGYLRRAKSGEYVIRAGADSPENFLAYADFDNTEDHPQAKREGEAVTEQLFLHRYEPHIRDWKESDPTWKNGKGKGIIGALNYLASKGMNSVYFLTMNVEGDGREVYPWTTYNKDLTRFDCSKLDQWEIVFSHMDRLGIMLHVLTQETENDKLLNNGDLGLERKLYDRELVARFGHHLAVQWNLGEETKRSPEQIKADAAWFKSIDPYRHPVVVHTYPGQYDKVYTPLLGFDRFDGPSLQMGNVKAVHPEVVKWVERSTSAGRRWYVCLDEIGPSDVGVKPDADDPGHDDVRRYALWGTLMGGGAGVEWYFGYKFPNNDLNCEDWRSREKMWDQTRFAKEFFEKNLPFAQMKPADDLVSNGAYCLAKPGAVYCIYIPARVATKLDLGSSTNRYSVQWFNPRAGGQMRTGSMVTITGPGLKNLGDPPVDPELDWVVLIRGGLMR